MPHTDPNDSIQSLARIAQAAARLMADMHRYGGAIDVHEEIDHMQGNLNLVRKEVSR
ncbi:hypothetical protein [Pseudactinotalea sp. Z1732]|uniref:hypothetical protein n=1 Tax=Micrococcales TaxID=85006 RepID=UPI003C7D774B